MTSTKKYHCSGAVSSELCKNDRRFLKNASQNNEEKDVWNCKQNKKVSFALSLLPSSNNLSTLLDPPTPLSTLLLPQAPAFFALLNYRLFSLASPTALRNASFPSLFACPFCPTSTVLLFPYSWPHQIFKKPVLRLAS